MLPPQFVENLRCSIKGKMLLDEQMKDHTSFCIGGSANIIIPDSISDLKKILELAGEDGVPVTIIGNGTNLLVSDDGLEGIVIKIKDCLDTISISKQRVRVGAGCTLSKLSGTVANCGLSSLEFAIGIPGTVGGAIVMNAGAHGGEMSDIVITVAVMNFRGEIGELPKQNLEFGYRKSKLQTHDLIVLNVEMELKKGNVTEIKEKMRKYLEWREKNQPVGIPNAGSIFKNPENDYAGRLVDLAGCKGMKVGGAQVSELKANFILNMGDATARDVSTLITRVQQRVYAKSGVLLEPEIKMI